MERRGNTEHMRIRMGIRDRAEELDRQRAQGEPSVRMCLIGCNKAIAHRTAIARDIETGVTGLSLEDAAEILVSQLRKCPRIVEQAATASSVRVVSVKAKSPVPGPNIYTDDCRNASLDQDFMV